MMITYLLSAFLVIRGTAAYHVLKGKKVRALLRQDPNFWKSRPLTDLMVRASLHDVCFLLKIHGQMLEKLSKVSLWRLAVRSELYCRCFCLNDNQFADWPPLPLVPDDIEADGYIPEVEHAAAKWGQLRHAAEREKLSKEYSLLSTECQADRRYLSRACIWHVEDLSIARARYLRASEWALAAGRYQDSADAINALAVLGFNLTSLEARLFDYCNCIAIQSLEHDPCLLEDSCHLKLAVYEEIRKRSKLVVRIIDTHILPFCSEEDAITFNIIKGRHWAAMAETKLEGQPERMEALVSYMAAVSMAEKRLNPLDPLRLRATVCLVSFLDDGMKHYERAYEIAGKAITKAEDTRRQKNNYSITVNSILDLLNKRMQKLFFEITGDKDPLPFNFHFDRRWTHKQEDKMWSTRSADGDLGTLEAFNTDEIAYRHGTGDEGGDLQFNQTRTREASSKKSAGIHLLKGHPLTNTDNCIVLLLVQCFIC